MFFLTMRFASWLLVKWLELFNEAIRDYSLTGKATPGKLLLAHKFNELIGAMEHFEITLLLARDPATFRNELPEEAKEPFDRMYQGMTHDLDEMSNGGVSLREIFASHPDNDEGNAPTLSPETEAFLKSLIGDDAEPDNDNEEPEDDGH